MEVREGAAHKLKPIIFRDLLVLSPELRHIDNSELTLNGLGTVGTSRNTRS